MSDWPFGELRPLSFGLILCDPAWSFDNWSAAGEAKNAKAQYECMPTAEIAALPVGHLASRDCWLWLWATHPMLDVAIDVMKGWGFKFVTSGVWVKRGPRSGKLAFGTGYVLRSCSEPFLLGKIGDPPTTSKSVRTVIEAARRQHSRKPDQAYAIAEKLFGDVARVELFSRQSRPGWTTWGAESTLFDGGEPASIVRDRAPSPAPALEPMTLFPEPI